MFRVGFGVSSKRHRTLTDFYLAIVGFNNDSKKGNEKIKTSLASILQLDIGYDITKSNIFALYPFAGLSIRLSNLNFLKPAETNPNYTNISNIVINNQSTYSTSFRLGYQVGLGIDVNLSGSKNKNTSTLFFTKFGINNPFTSDKYSIEGITYKPEIKQGDWILAFGFKFVNKQ